MTNDVENVKRPRGRPKKDRPIEDVIKRPRGRPKKEITKKPRWIKTGRPVGRPKIDPALKKPKYIPRPKKEKVVKEKKSRYVRKKIPMLSFEEARELMYDEVITSSHMYKKWYKLNVPAKLPKRPEAKYKKDWKGWNHFLRTNNKMFFDGMEQITYRPYKEAKIYAQSLGLKIRDEWFTFCKSGKKAKDVPSRPDVVYRKDWLGWKQFLGGSTIAHIETQKQSEKYIFIAQYEYMPHDVFRVDITNVGVQSLKYYSREQRFRIVKLYKLDNKDGSDQQMKNIINRHCEKWWEGEYGDYKCNNIFEMIMDLDQFYDTQPII